MRTVLTLLLTAALTALAAAQPPKKKLPAPKVVEEDGKKVALFEYGKTTDEVKVGELVYKLHPLNGTNERSFFCGYYVTNTSNNSVPKKTTLTVPSGWKAVATDSTGRTFRSESVAASVVGQLDPGKRGLFEVELAPLPNPKATAVTVTLPAPPNSGADLWRVTYPKKTWRPNKD